MEEKYFNPKVAESNAVFGLTCPVCENEKWIKVYRVGTWDIEECRNCGFAKIDPLPARDNRKQCYSKEEVIARNTKKRSFSSNLSRALKQLFSKATKRNKSEMFYGKLCNYLPPQAKILDIGCGDGSFLRLAENQFGCAGIEISEHLASLAKKINGADIKCGNFLSTEFNETYDAITLISLLEHLDDPLGALRKCFSLLNKNGILVLKTVNYACLNRKIKKEKWTGLRPPDHVVYFTPHNLALILKKAGFSKIKVKAWPFNDNMYCDAFKYADDRRFSALGGSAYIKNRWRRTRLAQIKVFVKRLRFAARHGCVYRKTFDDKRNELRNRCTIYDTLNLC